ncbi:MAG: PAS domain S-box protein, partial [Desulfovibrionaceae bacterium]|nr:PAS domain S-box protein [Desulfovibrionaceae bacterium]
MTDRGREHKAFALLFEDLVTNIMALADSPGKYTDYLARQVRELIAVRTVVIMECRHFTGELHHKLLNAHPERRRDIGLAPEIEQLAELSHAMDKATLITPDSATGGESLRLLGLGASIVVPLQYAGNRLGVMFLLDIMDTENVEAITSSLEKLSPIMALILRNAHLYQNLEQEVATRTLELRANEERYRAMFSSVSDPVLVADRNTGILVECNEAAEMFFGRTRKQLIGLPQWELHPKTAPKVNGKTEDFHDAVVAPGRRKDIPLLAAGGKVRLAEIQTKTFDMQGHELILGVFRDVTDRNRTEQILRESEEKYRALIETTDTGFVILDHQGRVLEANEEYVRLTGYRRLDEILGRRVVDWTAPHEKEKNAKAVARCLRDRSIRNLEIDYLWPDGRIISVELNATVQGEGEALQIITLCRDITKRKQDEEVLRRTEALLRAMLINLPLDFWARKPSGEIILQSDVSRSIWGDLTRLHQDTVVPGKTLNSWQSNNARALAGEKVDSEAEYVLPNGEQAYYHEILAPIRDHEEILGVMGVNVDLTEHRRLMRELYDSKEKAVVANRTKSEFLANMSHEIRTPLNGVLGMLQLLQTTRPTVEQKEYLLAAIQSSRRLTRLLGDILDLSRIEAGKLVIQEVEFELLSHRLSVMELFEESAKKKGLELTFVIDERLPAKLIGDDARLRQILFNLVGNAVKFTEKGRVRVEASPLALVDGKSLRVLFTIQDTGIGIPEDRLQDIFEPFVQAEGAYTKSFQGAGLGLSIVRKLVGLLGGDIAIDSTEGDGTTFCLSLPFKLQSSSQTAEQPAGVASPAVSECLSVLFAEDDEVNLISGKRMLEKSGY